MPVKIYDTNVNNNELNNLLKNNTLFVGIFSETCSHCINMKSEWNKFKSLLVKENLNGTILEINAKVLSSIKNPLISNNANGFPSLFIISNNKFVTNFRNGTVHLLFYATEYDEIGNQMIPDNYRIREYVEAFIKFKMFETLTNQTNDETFNQLQQKMMYHKQAYEEAYIMADIEVKKQTPWEKQRRIKNDLNRFNMYELPNRTNRYGRRRNN
jgi:hypothetical protein